MRPEDQLQASVARFLDRVLPSASWWTATANGAHLAGDARSRAMQANRMKATGIKKGTPDILILHDGRLLSIELKAAKGKLSDAQADVADAITNAGGGYTVSRSIEDVQEYLIAMGVPLRGSTGEARPIGEIIQPILQDIARKAVKAA